MCVSADEGGSKSTIIISLNVTQEPKISLFHSSLFFFLNYCFCWPCVELNTHRMFTWLVISAVVTNHLSGQHFCLQSQRLSLNRNCTLLQIPTEAGSQEERLSFAIIICFHSLRNTPSLSHFLLFFCYLSVHYSHTQTHLWISRIHTHFSSPQSCCRKCGMHTYVNAPCTIFDPSILYKGCLCCGWICISGAWVIWESDHLCGLGCALQCEGTLSTTTATTTASLQLAGCGHSIPARVS